MRAHPIIPVLLLALAAPAFAATPIDQTRPLSPDGQVSIDNLKGRIVVRGWDRPEVKITGSLGDGVEKLVVEGNERDLRIEVRYPQKRGGWFGWGGGDGGAQPSVIEVSLPRGASLDLDSVSANIDVTGTGGRRLAVDTVSGDVLVRAARAEEARFDSVSGDIDAEIDSRDLGVDSVSGDILLKGGITGRVSLDSVSGDASLEGGRVERLTLSSVSGDGRLSVALAPGGNISTDSVSGNLTLVLPGDTSARLRVETFSGGISSPVGKVHTEEYGPGKSLDARLGAGSGHIRLESFSGNVRVETR